MNDYGSSYHDYHDPLHWHQWYTKVQVEWTWALSLGSNPARARPGRLCQWWWCKNYPVCVPILPLPKLPHVIRGYKLTYSGMAWNWRVTMFRLWRCAVWRGHDGGNALKDEVTPTPLRLRAWPALEMTIVIFENWILHLAGHTMHPSDNWLATLQTR